MVRRMVARVILFNYVTIAMSTPDCNGASAPAVLSYSKPGAGRV